MWKYITYCLIAIASFGFTGCQIEEPEFSDPYNINITKVQGQTLELTFQNRVKNPNSRTLKVQKADLDVFFNNTYLGQTELKEPIDIPANYDGEKTYNLKVNLDEPFERLILPVLLSGLGGNNTIRLKGEVAGKVGWFRKKVEFEHSEPISLDDLL